MKFPFKQDEPVTYTNSVTKARQQATVTVVTKDEVSLRLAPGVYVTLCTQDALKQVSKGKH